MAKVLRKFCFLLVIIFFFILFRGPIFQGESFVFRDESYFYYPMVRYTHSFWAAGKLPLWDPLTNLGQPLAAIPTATAFYPGKLIFLLEPLLGFAYQTCYKWFIISHVLLAFFTMFKLTKQWSFSVVGSTIAGISYAFGGAILFQYCNFIFLIGAAWLPLTVFFADKIIRGSFLRGVCGLAFCLAMMVLGGDPEMAYLSGLPIIFLYFLYWLNGYFHHGLRTQDSPFLRNGAKRRNIFQNVTLLPFCFIVLAAILGGLLSAIQILPSQEVSALSDRAVRHVPVSLWEIPGFLREEKKRLAEEALLPTEKTPLTGHIRQFDDSPDSPDLLDEGGKEDIQAIADSTVSSKILDGLLCRQMSDSIGHAYFIYQFSLAPWQFIELIWPNISGTLMPNNTRWSDGLPNVQCWTPSLYMSVIPLVLGLAVFRLGKGRKKHLTAISIHHLVCVWGSWIFLFGCLASLGLFGPNWFCRALWNLFGADKDLTITSGDPVGGLYWLMNLLLPGFSSFRYPIKVFTLAAMALAVLAGLGWDVSRKSPRLKSIVQFVGGISFLALCFFWYKGSDLFYFAHIPQHHFLGPYQPELAWQQALKSLSHVLVVLSLFYFLFLQVRSRRLFSRFAGIMVLLLIVADLYVANSVLLMTGPDALFDNRSSYYQKIVEQGDVSNFFQTPPIRTWRQRGTAASFYDTISQNRGSERVLWEQHVLTPNYHQRFGIGSIDAPGTLTLANYDKNFASVLATPDEYPGVVPAVIFLGTDYFIRPANASIDTEQVECLLSPSEKTAWQKPNDFIPEAYALWKITGQNEKIKIFHNAPELADPHLSILKWVEKGKFGNPLEGEYARYAHYEPNQLEIEVNLQQEATLLVMEQYCVGWRAMIRPWDEPHTAAQPLPIECGLQFLRKLTLPSGHYRVTMEYYPTSFYWGATISLVSWLIWGLLLYSLSLGYRIKLEIFPILTLNSKL